MNLNPFKKKTIDPSIFLNRSGRRAEVAYRRKEQSKRGLNFTKSKKRK